MQSDILTPLNDLQREAVETIGGPLLIVAGPGSGKTRVITSRIAYLVRECGVRPYNIVAMTFTNKAANELRERLDSMLGLDATNLAVSTFHSFCVMVLRRDGQRIGLDRNFVIYDESDKGKVMKRSEDTAEALGLDVDEQYENLMAQSSAVDFDGLLSKTKSLFREHPDVAEHYQNRFLHVMVDEFQDTNIDQYEIAKQLSAKNNNLCVVGDPDQSIYSWRDADIRNILNFPEDHPDAKLITLEENYRSTKTILGAAQNLITENKERIEKDLWTSNSGGVPIVVSEEYTPEDEAQAVVKEIERLRELDGRSRRDIAILYRTNVQSEIMESACTKYGVPYSLVSGRTKFYNRKEVKDLISYLRLINNPYDNVAFSRIINVPPRRIGRTTVKAVEQIAKDSNMSMFSVLECIQSTSKDSIHGPDMIKPRALRELSNFRDMICRLKSDSENMNPSQLIGAVRERSGYDEYIQAKGNADGDRIKENLGEFRDQNKEASNLTELLEKISLVGDTDDLDQAADTVTLMTLHQAKGLEFPIIFILGMEEGLLPHSRAIATVEENGEENGIEEERRLFYVGVTRAKERLYLYRSFKRSLWGGNSVNLPSRFLNEIPRDLIVSPKSLSTRTSPQKSLSTRTSPQKSLSTRTSPQTSTASRVKVINTGDKILHEAFGEGIVINTKPLSGETEVVVAFDAPHGLKHLLLGIAPMEKI